MEYMHNGNLEKLKGKTITKAYLREHADMALPTIQFSDGTIIEIWSDDEGNDGGSVHISFGIATDEVVKVKTGDLCLCCTKDCGERYWTIPLVKGHFCSDECGKKHRKENPKQIPCASCDKQGDWTWHFKGMKRGTRCCSSECCEVLRTNRAEAIAS